MWTHLKVLRSSLIVITYRQRYSRESIDSIHTRQFRYFMPHQLIPLKVIHNHRPATTAPSLQDDLQPHLGADNLQAYH